MTITFTRVEPSLLTTNSFISLLPEEVKSRRKLKVFRRRSTIALILFALLIAGYVYLLKAQGVQAEKDLAIAQSNASYLQSQQSAFGEVREIQSSLDSQRAAQQVGGATEIDWRQFFLELQHTLPNGATLDSFMMDQETPFAPYTQSSAPLQRERIATINFSATSPTLPQVSTWIAALSNLPGFVDASPGAIIRNESGSYSLSAIIHVGKSAFTNRYLVGGKTR